MSRSRPRVVIAVLVKFFGGAYGRTGFFREEVSCKGNRNFPVGTRFAGRRDGGAHARDAALGVGDGALLLRPACGREEHVGVGAGLGIAEGFLHHYQLGAQ